MTKKKKTPKIDFSIGQHVKVIKTILADDCGMYLGKIGEVAAIEQGKLPIKIWFEPYGMNYFEAEELELVKEEHNESSNL